MSDAFGPWTIFRRKVGAATFGPIWRTLNNPDARSTDDTDAVPAEGWEYRLNQQTSVGHVQVPYNDVKISNPGKFRWANQIKSNRCNLDGVAIDSTGNTYVVGQWSSYVDFGAPVGRINVPVDAGGHPVGAGGFLAKYDSLGTLLWARILGYSKQGGLYYVAVDASDNVVVSGSFSGVFDFGGVTLTCVGNEVAANVFIAKYSPSNMLAWVKQAIGCYYSSGLGIDPSGNVGFYLFYGSDFTIDSTTATKVTSGMANFCIGKLSSSGTVQWMKQYGGGIASVGSVANIFGMTLAIDPVSGDMAVTGYFQTESQTAGGINFGDGAVNNDNTFSGFLVKYSGSGVYQWKKIIKSAALYASARTWFACNIASDQTIYFVGAFTPPFDFGNGTKTIGNMFLSSYSSSGTIGFVRIFGTNSSLGSFPSKVTSRSGIIAMAGSAGLTEYFNDEFPVDTGNGANQNLFIALYSAANVPRWYYRAGSGTGNANSQSNCVAMDAAKVVIGGMWNQTLSFEAGGTNYVCPAYENYGFIAAYNP